MATELTTRCTNPAVLGTVNELLAGVAALELGLSSLDLPAQVLEGFQPHGLNCVIGSGGMYVRTGYGEMHLSLHCGRTLPAAFKVHRGRGDQRQRSQIPKSVFNPCPNPGPCGEALDLNLGGHDCVVSFEHRRSWRKSGVGHRGVAALHRAFGATESPRLIVLPQFSRAASRSAAAAGARENKPVT